MALTTEEQELLDFGAGALPPWFRDEARDMAIEAGMAKMAGAARAQQEYWFAQAYIETAEGATATTPDWLQLHAIDRGTRRAAGELDAELRVRLRQYPDAMTRDALIAIAQSIIDAAGVVGDVALLEPRRDRMWILKNLPMTGTGGSFAAGPNDESQFTPTTGWPAPPLRGANIKPPLGHNLTISGAASAGNDGTFPVERLVMDAAAFDNPGAVFGADPGVDWSVDRISEFGVQLTSPTGLCDGYLSRGYRIGSIRNSIIIILPYGTTEATAGAVAEAVRQRKAAGFRVTVERRLNP